MSYCRWSSNDFQCDVYVYEHYDGWWVTEVASRRHDLSEVELPGPIILDPDDPGPWIQRHQDVQEILDACELKPIGLEFDGGSFRDDTPGACADRLAKLKALGYLVPDHAIETLREEQAQEQTEP